MPSELRHDQLEETLHAGRLALPRENQRLLGRNRKSPVFGVMLGVARRADRSEPFVEILRVEAQLFGKLIDRQATGAIERGEHSCLIAEIGHEEAHRTGDIADDLADQGVEDVFVECVGHGSSSAIIGYATRSR